LGTLAATLHAKRRGRFFRESAADPNGGRPEASRLLPRVTSGRRRLRAKPAHELGSLWSQTEP